MTDKYISLKSKITENSLEHDNSPWMFSCRLTDDLTGKQIVNNKRISIGQCPIFFIMPHFSVKQHHSITKKHFCQAFLSQKTLLFIPFTCT